MKQCRNGPNGERLITRRVTRALWDHTAHAYTTIRKLSENVKAGESIHVRCKVTGRDLTRRVLFQILEQGATALPIDFLMGLVRL